MIFTIPKDHHRARPLRLALWWNKTSFTWKIYFDESAQYDLGNTDQFDTNKLCGIGYLPGHHTDSARFGWRYWTDRKEIELTAYCYVKGRRVIQHVCFCEIGKEYRIRLRVLATCYYFDVYEPNADKAAGSTTIDHYHNKKLGYRLGTYFGGQAMAPHDIKIELTKA